MTGHHLEECQFQLMLYGCVVSVYCVGFESLDVVCDELHDCTYDPGL